MVDTPNFKIIEKKWQKKWTDKKVFKAVEDSKKKKYYVLEMYPYPSSSGLHMGHARNYVIGDVFARFKRMNGFNVLYPMGYDSFGLPAENAAIAAKSHPKIFTENAIKNFVKQQKALGLSYDWDRMIYSHDPGFYKWDQWVFLQMYKKGLAFKRTAAVNWCPECNTVLANEQVHSGKCWRHTETNVEVRDLNQWFYKITDYADELLKDIDNLKDWAEDVKLMQKNWIGKSHGTLIDFQIDGSDKKFSVFTTRPDTFWGITFLVYAPEHPDVMDLVRGTEYEDKVKKFVQKVVLQDRFERTAENKEKEGMFIGRYAVHPATKEKIPVYIANFVLYEYGTGAIIAVPAHDQRDFEFAKKYKIPIKVVINPAMFGLNLDKMTRAYMGDGNMVNSGKFNGDNNRDAIPEINKFLEKNGWGKVTVQYKLRDWLISRQRFWGCPIPVVYCEKCAKKKQKVLIIHGFEGSSDSNWYPWFKKELETYGFDVIIPDMPSPDHPKLKEWLDELIRITKDFDENDIIIGHSLGGKAALHLAEKLKTNSVYLVAPVTCMRLDWPFYKKKWPDSDIDALKKFTMINYDLSKIEANTRRKVLILSDNDPYIPVRTQDNFDKNKWEIKILSNKLHIQDPLFIELFQEIIKDKKEAGTIAVPEKDLPVKLPEDVKFDAGGGNPLAKIESFVNTKCPNCGGPAKRETDTMDTFVDSAWYFLRYCDPKNDKAIFDKKKIKYWMPIDTYIGGKEHATMHLIYFRFYIKFLRDIGLLDFDEPTTHLFNQGMLHKGGFVMSKSRGNVITQEQIENKYGIDTARFFLMFVASPDKDMEWDDKAVEGSYRFLVKVYDMLKRRNIVNKIIKNQESKTHKTILEVTDYISSFRYNLALISIMKLANYLYSKDEISRFAAKNLLLLLAPFTPHLAEEFWEKISGKGKNFISLEQWPEGNKKKVDYKLEAGEDLYLRVRRDILALQDLTGLTKPNKIMLILADAWKYKFISGLKKGMSRTRDIGKLIKTLSAVDKQNSKLIANFVPKFVKNPDKLPEVVLSQAIEKKALADFAAELKKEFNTKFELVDESRAKHEKASQAMPGKPAIVFA